ncbi:hypothetical protein JG687_00017301, partial [Phytophthora cactorum]
SYVVARRKRGRSNIGGTLAKFENHAETEVLLQIMVPKMTSESDGPRICVCNNANANRSLIERVFGEVVIVKQDHFHVILRFTENIKDSAKRVGRQQSSPQQYTTCSQVFGPQKNVKDA